LKFKDKIFYGWVVTATFFVIGTAVWGIRFSYGVFFKSIESEFDLSRAATSSIFSAHMALGVLVAIAGGWALDRFGPKIVILTTGLLAALSLLLTSQTSTMWHLFITYSVLLAMGGSATYVVIISTVSRWFDRKRGLALGIASSGMGLGTVVMAPLATSLISHFDWRTTYLIMGIICLVIVIPLSFLLKGEPREIGLLPDGAKTTPEEPPNQRTTKIPDTSVNYTLPQALKTWSLWLIMIIFLCIALCFFLVTTHLVPRATDAGVSGADAAVVLSVQGIMLVVGRIAMGIVSDKIGTKKTVITCIMLEVAVMLWLVWSHELWMFYLFAVVFGFGYGGTGPSIATIAGKTFGLRNFGKIMGILEIGFGVGAAIGPAAGGLIFDVTNSYSIAFLMGAGIMLLATVLMLPVGREIYAHNKHYGPVSK
jgi:MFS family permease